MGVSLSTTAKVAEGLLDFENSITKEVEASVLIGRQLNFQKARELALSGDIAGATKDIVKQLGSEVEFNKLNLIQRKALADSIGVSVSELSKMVGQTDKLTLSGAMAAGSFDDLTGQQALSNLSKITNEVKALFSEALILIGPEIENLAEKFKIWIDESGGVAALKEMFLSLAKGIATVIQYTPHLISLMVGLKVASIATAIAVASLASAKSAAAAPWTMGTSALVAAASIVAAWGTFKMLSVDDFKSGPGGITTMMGPAGIFSLNPKDSVLATTNPISVTKTDDFPKAGGLMPAHNPPPTPTPNFGTQRETNELLKGILGATSNEKTIVTDSQVKRISYTGGLGGGLNPYG